ncbi:pectate lyase family protein [Phytoactinopolyspora endophytica]|uniref:pectate lyase family protein n=1 Tax=Phytoactinopolyspora endophytica TaxID=1642495 RepID=UPI00197BAE2C|nr:hypothetical protein [Phytoactinopolyspora endophytica]
MRKLTMVSAVGLLVAGSLTVSGASHGSTDAERSGDRDRGREVLAPDDGWAAAEGGTTGGAEAASEHVYTVRTQAELREAVQGDHPKIVYVEGDIDAMTDDEGNALACNDFNDPDYDFDAYLEAYDPVHWDGRAEGPLEDARRRSANSHAGHIRVEIGSNTTVIGLGSASVTNAAFRLESVDNVIIRNLGIHDAYDCFPQWRGSDWDAQYDNIEISRSTHVWIDHVTLTNGDTVDSDEPHYLGAIYDRHDGLLDIARESDLVTVSWSVLADHDKSLLWGNGDNRPEDRGKLRITLHHNHLVNLTQRAPRVRYGQVHVYNNLYTHEADSDYPYGYSWGVGVESAIYAENNFFRLSDGITSDRIIHQWGGTAIHESGTVVNGRDTDVLAAFNDANEPDLASDVGWEPELHGTIHPTRAVPGLVRSGAGAGKLRAVRPGSDVR